MFWKFRFRKVDLLKIDVDSIPHDALLVALLSSGLRAKVGPGTTEAPARAP